MNDSVAERLASLQREYAGTLPARVAAVAAGWQALAQARGLERGRAYAELVRNVHSLSGSAGSFGCEDLGRAARQLEAFLGAQQPDAPSATAATEFARLLGDVERAAWHCCAQLGVSSQGP